MPKNVVGKGKCQGKEQLAVEPIQVAVCGNLFSASALLLRLGNVTLRHWEDAAELALCLAAGHIQADLILVYAPAGEGLFPATFAVREGVNIPMRLLDEPLCSSAMAELTMLHKGILQQKQEGK